MAGLKNSKIMLAAFLALVFSFGLFPTWAAEKVKVATALKFQAVFAMPMLAIEENGFWKQQGLEAEWVPFDAGTAMHRALAAGALQVGITDITAVISVISRGLPVVIACHMGPVTDYAVWVRSDSPIKQPADLKGKRMDVTQLGGTSHGYGRLIARALGLEEQIRFVGTGGLVAGIAALKAGATDTGLFTYFAVANLLAAGEARSILEVDDYLPKEWVGRVVYARRDFVEHNPEVAGKVVKAILQGTDFVMKNRGWTLERMKSYSRYIPQAAEFLYPRLTYSRDGRIDKKALANVREFLIKSGVISPEKTPVVDELYTDQFTR